MSSTVKKIPPSYLREARIRAGYVNRETASTAVPFSPETIGRHERGDVEMEPEDVMIYAKCYQSPDILPRYCATCPVGRATGRTATDRSLPHATLRISRLLEDAQAVADRLEEIAFDGVIAPDEKQDFENVLMFLRKLEESINDIILIGLGKEKALPGRPPKQGKRNIKTFI